MREKTARAAIVVAVSLLLLLSPLVFSGCATSPPPGITSAQALTFQASINSSGQITTQWTSSQGRGYLGFYRIVINDFNTSLIGNETAVTTNPSTWTNYLELNNGGWIRNDRIAAATSLQPQQWTGPQPITPGSVSNGGTTMTFALTLPDSHMGSATRFNVSFITYIAPQSNPTGLVAISAFGPTLSPSSPIQYMSFNDSIDPTNTLTDTTPDDWLADPVDFPDLSSTEYINFDVASLTVIER